MICFGIFHTKMTFPTFSMYSKGNKMRVLHLHDIYLQIKTIMF